MTPEEFYSKIENREALSRGIIKDPCYKNLTCQEHELICFLVRSLMRGYEVMFKYPDKQDWVDTELKFIQDNIDFTKPFSNIQEILDLSEDFAKNCTKRKEK